MYSGRTRTRFNGMVLPLYEYISTNPALGFRQLRDFRSRPSDILICGPIKSGSHWILELVSILISGKLEYSANTLVDGNIEMNVDKLEEKQDPRILLSHLPYRYLPRAHRENNYKIILILRNPKDRAVSSFFFLQNKFETFDSSWEWKDYFNDVVMGKKTNEVELFGSWFSYIREWGHLLKDANKTIHVVYYEDLQKNFEKEITKLAKFISVERSEEFYRALQEVCSFVNMKKFKPDDTGRFDKDGYTTLYRKGEVGDWKNFFTVQQNEEFNDLLDLELADLCLNFTYE